MPLPTVMLPGYLESAIAYSQLQQSLQQMGFPTMTVPLRRHDWIVTFGGRPVTPIVRLLDRTVKQALQQSNASQINLIGHSAGGWISRISVKGLGKVSRVRSNMGRWGEWGSGGVGEWKNNNQQPTTVWAGLEDKLSV